MSGYTIVIKDTECVVAAFDTSYQALRHVAHLRAMLRERNPAAKFSDAYELRCR